MDKCSGVTTTSFVSKVMNKCYISSLDVWQVLSVVRGQCGNVSISHNTMAPNFFLFETLYRYRNQHSEPTLVKVEQKALLLHLNCHSGFISYLLISSTSAAGGCSVATSMRIFTVWWQTHKISEFQAVTVLNSSYSSNNQLQWLLT